MALFSEGKLNANLIIFENTIANRDIDGTIHTIYTDDKTDQEIYDEYKVYLTEENHGKYILFRDSDNQHYDELSDYDVMQIIVEGAHTKKPLIIALHRGKGMVQPDLPNKELRKARKIIRDSQRSQRVNTLGYNPYGRIGHNGRRGHIGGKKTKHSRKTKHKKTAKKIHKNHKKHS